MNITNQLSKALALLLVLALVWGGIFSLAAFWIFGASISVAWTVGLSIFGGMLLCAFVICCELYRSIDPRELQDDEGNEFLEALLLGSAEF